MASSDGCDLVFSCAVPHVVDGTSGSLGSRLCPKRLSLAFLSGGEMGSLLWQLCEETVRRCRALLGPADPAFSTAQLVSQVQWVCGCCTAEYITKGVVGLLHPCLAEGELRAGIFFGVLGCLGLGRDRWLEGFCAYHVSSCNKCISAYLSTEHSQQKREAWCVSSFLSL